MSAPITASIDIDAMLKRLHLANARRIWRELCQRAEKEEWTYEHLLAVLVAEEVAHRAQTRLGRVCRKAGFPFLKTVDDFDFTFQSTLRISMLGSLLSPDFVTEGCNVVFHGKPGRGKTHLAIAIAYRAIQNGFDAFFTTAAALIDDLSRASAEGRLREALLTYVQPHVLVVDEVGYLTYGTDAANVLFHVVNERHLRRRSMVFTTNKALKQWGRVLHDEDLGDAIIDRILERGRVIKLDGPSVRARHVDPADLDGSDQEPARISGTDRPSFPEPTGSESSQSSPPHPGRGSPSPSASGGVHESTSQRPAVSLHISPAAQGGSPGTQPDESAAGSPGTHRSAPLQYTSSLHSRSRVHGATVDESVPPSGPPVHHRLRLALRRKQRGKAREQRAVAD